MPDVLRLGHPARRSVICPKAGSARQLFGKRDPSKECTAPKTEPLLFTFFCVRPPPFLSLRHVTGTRSRLPWQPPLQTPFQPGCCTADDASALADDGHMWVNFSAFYWEWGSASETERFWYLPYGVHRHQAALGRYRSSLAISAQSTYPVK